ncbi:hypothetical protein [Herminiimonas sp. CN]|uniref:hypothetical protein n=1 Tax=Herminiimonas sp. CN TaxID=1349818 RepID=UPI001EE67A00|nr:hypothetical protein [Herminiimonas sp. CN]
MTATASGLISVLIGLITVFASVFLVVTGAFNCAGVDFASVLDKGFILGWEAAPDAFFTTVSDSSNLAVFPACVRAGDSVSANAAFPVLELPGGREAADVRSTDFDAADFSAVDFTFASLGIWNLAVFFIALTME